MSLCALWASASPVAEHKQVRAVSACECDPLPGPKGPVMMSGLASSQIRAAGVLLACIHSSALRRVHGCWAVTPAKCDAGTALVRRPCAGSRRHAQQIGCAALILHAWTQLPPTFSVFAEALLMAASTLGPVSFWVELKLPMFAVAVWLACKRGDDKIQV